MPGILDSLSHPALEKATEIMYQTGNTYIGRFFGASFYHELEATWFVTDPIIGLNRVISTPFTPDTPKGTIDETLKQIAVSSTGSMTWDIGPSIKSAGLEECLRANGWSKEGEVRSMVLDVHALETHMPYPAKLVIGPVDDEETFKQHVDTMIAGFEFPEPMAHRLSHIDYGTFLNDPAVYYYVGHFQGKPVAISVLLLCEGIAGIYNVATVPQMRHQGFGTAMTHHALLKALDLGYHVAVLQASKMGVSVYRHLGFQDHFTFASYDLTLPD